MRNNISLTISVAVILIFVGLIVLSYNYVNTKRELVYNTINLDISNDVILGTDNNDEQSEEEVEEVKPEENSSDENKTYEYYVGKLEIPKIGFSRGFYDKDSSLNNVKWNIKVLKESNYPDVANGNLMIIGHSGNYSNSYFSNLYKLENGDIAYIYYKNTKYTYQVVNIYNENKDGNIEIKRNANKNVLTLITCTKDDELHQTVYILELTDKTNV